MEMPLIRILTRKAVKSLAPGPRATRAWTNSKTFGIAYAALEYVVQCSMKSNCEGTDMKTDAVRAVVQVSNR
ncbi:hypothetical protein AWB67_07107 [Caballeronia terrestris]|uniref:Uncharacterized protein n=1 Tax=Caballeronia terrestris TaxID=1226301 RepID=A0A158L0A6_9BURK|nr:hypothetical protein AWB67_07107 [Caballeronia terrestris]